MAEGSVLETSDRRMWKELLDSLESIVTKQNDSYTRLKKEYQNIAESFISLESKTVKQLSQFDDFDTTFSLQTKRYKFLKRQLFLLQSQVLQSTETSRSLFLQLSELESELNELKQSHSRSLSPIGVGIICFFVVSILWSFVSIIFSSLFLDKEELVY